MGVFNNFKDLFLSVWEKGILGIDFFQIIIGIGIFFIFLIFRGLISKLIIKKLEVISKRTTNKLDDAFVKSMEGPARFLPIVLGVFFASYYMSFSDETRSFVDNINRTLITVLIFWIIHQIIEPVSYILSGLDKLLTRELVGWIIKSLKILIFILGAAAVLELWGIKIGPIIAGLGLFGVAVALGAQDLFKNLISGLLIIGENRFQPGDRIEVPGSLHGMVEDIGFRSTLVRMFDTAPMLVPNKDLSDVKVINHGEMVYRRISWHLNLIYSTTQEQLAKICEDITTFINSSDDFTENPEQESFARTAELGSSSIDIRILCYTDPVGLTDFSKIKQNLIFEIINIVRSNGSEFAYPSTSVYIEDTDPVDITQYSTEGLKSENVSHTSAPDEGDGDV